MISIFQCDTILDQSESFAEYETKEIAISGDYYKSNADSKSITLKDVHAQQEIKDYDANEKDPSNHTSLPHASAKSTTSSTSSPKSSPRNHQVKNKDTPTEDDSKKNM